MKLALFNYQLPSELIAQKPATPRDHSRLLIYSRKSKSIKHDTFFNLPKYLTANDVLVFNNSKVFPARLIGQKETGGRAEVLLLKEQTTGRWEVLLGMNRPKQGQKLRFARGLEAKIVSECNEKTWLLDFNFRGAKFHAILDTIGQIPIPPYINSKSPQNLLKKQYQTIYAKPLGSAAAPTAGLHFTKKLMQQIKKTGCQIEYVTLHVGLGTFDPIKTDRIEDYQIHSENISIDEKTLRNLRNAKKAKKRIIAVGTTATRTLESVFGNEKHIEKTNISEDTNIFIYPGYKFKFVDAMITNFHLPKSSLLMLVAAFIGRTSMMKLYKLAIKKKYRFFSFGDAMFLQ